MREVAFFEDSCSRPSGTASLVEFLRERFEGRVDVRAYDVGRAETRVPVPPELLTSLLRRGSACLPAMTIDGAVFTEGWLPTPEAAVAFVATGVAEIDPD